MARHCSDLPRTRFPLPVYALGSQFSGYRWLAGWEQDTRGWPSSVGLGHGGPDRKTGFIVVHTFRKSIFERFTPPLGEPVSGSDRPTVLYAAGPTGYTDAFSRAVTSLVHTRLPGEPAPSPQQLGARWGNLLTEAQWDDPRTESMHRPPRLGNSWMPTTVTVDGEDHPADTREFNGRWATLVDLPHLAVMVSGPEGLRHLADPLTDARAELTGYK